MARIVADQIVSALVHAGVKRIYGIVGDSLNPITDAVRRAGSLNWILSVWEPAEIISPPARSTTSIAMLPL
jgi:thiamine pyrophosphate-dependent acetolactate synthase large subunit-like protein